MLELNKIYNMDCVEGMKLIESGSIDLTVTSPPYDKLKLYNGFIWNFEDTANELFRITKDGGVVVWVVGDATVNGSETGTSFKQALYFKDIGFNLHDTMIYMKSGVSYPETNRYLQQFEYMFVFSKNKPITTNIIKDRENKYVGTIGGNHRGGLCTRSKFGSRFNVWYYANGKYNTSKDNLAFKHPAIFPEKLAEDHIISWSNEGDVVLDPFMGSGTTAKMAKANRRNFIGFEISKEYCDIANIRIKE